MHPEPGSKRHTRVVWDLENVRVPANQTFQLVLSLERWLTAQQLWGSNVDGLITCFYNPQTTPKAVSEALDRAGVEQVLEIVEGHRVRRKMLLIEPPLALRE